MATIKPQLRVTETYTESNFLRLHTCEPREEAGGELRSVTLEHLSYRPAGSGAGGWQCLTIVDRERMSKGDALFIARAYARENEIPVIYECHGG
jgi:hypothetical protein